MATEAARTVNATLVRRLKSVVFLQSVGALNQATQLTSMPTGGVVTAKNSGQKRHQKDLGRGPSLRSRKSSKLGTVTSLGGHHLKMSAHQPTQTRRWPTVEPDSASARQCPRPPATRRPTSPQIALHFADREWQVASAPRADVGEPRAWPARPCDHSGARRRA